MVCLLGLASSAFAQNRVPSTTPVTGTFIFTFTINIAGTIDSAAKIGCIADASLAEQKTFNTLDEEASSIATRSGSTATCTVTIPYSWNLATPGSDKVILSYTVEAPVNTNDITMLRQRMSRQTIGRIPVPPNGSTTNETITATI
jgi:hypothetical protein